MYRLAGHALVAWLAMGTIVSAAGCKRRSADAAPSCTQVAAKFLEVARHDLAGAKADEATSRAVNDQLPAIRDALAQACTEGKWSEAIRNCLVRANDHVDFETCEQQLTDEQRRGLAAEQRRDLDRGSASGSGPSISSGSAGGTGSAGSSDPGKTP